MLMAVAAFLAACDVTSNPPTNSIAIVTSGSGTTMPSDGTRTTSTTVGQRSECSFTEVMSSYLENSPDGFAELAASPLAPSIEAARVGAPMPRLSEAAATWTSDKGPGESLVVAIWLNCPTMVRQILDFGVPADGLFGSELSGWSPAMHAASLREWTIVELLLDEGADPLREDFERNSLLTMSVVEVEVLESVLERLDLAEISVPMGPLAVALDRAAISPQSSASLDLLLATGVRPMVSTLWLASELVRDQETFDVLASFAVTSDYSGVSADPVEAIFLREICQSMVDPERDRKYRQADLDTLSQILGEELPC